MRKKVINFSKWRLRHSLLKTNSLKAGNLAGFNWRPDFLNFGIASAKKSSCPSKAFSWLQSSAFSSSHRSLFQGPEWDKVSSPMAVLHHREEEGLTYGVGAHTWLNSNQWAWFWASCAGERSTISTPHGMAYPGRVSFHRPLPFQVSSLAKYVVIILLSVLLHVCPLINVTTQNQIIWLFFSSKKYHPWTIEHSQSKVESKESD